MPDFGNMKAVDIRDVWRMEARDFTPWLAENIGKLAEAIGMELEVEQREAPVGDFSLDLLAKDLGSGRHVVIENQFGATNHDHFGKILTYAAGVDASTVVWVTETVREEHRQALEWLNRQTEDKTRFFAVEVAVVKIDDSRPAVVFKAVVSPNAWQRDTKLAADRRTSPRAESYRRYFQLLLDELREKHRFSGAKAAQPQNWYSFASGVSGISYSTSFTRDGRVRVEVYIDRGDGEENEAIFNGFLNDKNEIERAFGDALAWERLDDRRACRVAVYRDGSIEDAESELSEIRAWVVERLLRLRRVFGRRLQRLVDDAAAG
jgi:hypothetical protein